MGVLIGKKGAIERENCLSTLREVKEPEEIIFLEKRDIFPPYPIDCGGMEESNISISFHQPTYP